MNWNDFPHPPPPPPPPPPPGVGPHPGPPPHGHHPPPPPPPPPPPGTGPHPGPPPPPSYSNSPFWDFINSFGPGPANRHSPDAGYGVDHADSPYGFTFGPAGFNAWSGRHGFHGNWGGFGGRGGRRGGRHGHDRCRQCHSNPDSDEEDTCCSSNSSGDEEMRDVNAAAPAAARTPDTESPASQEGVTLDDKRDTSATLQDGEHPDPPEEVPSSPPPHRGRHGGRCGGRGRHGHGPFGGRGGRNHCGPGGPGRLGGRHDHHHHHHHHHHHRGPPGGGGGPPPPFPFSFPFGAGGPRGRGGGGPGGPGGDGFDFNAMMNALADHPFARGLREHWAEIQQHRQQRRDRAATAAANNNREEEQIIDQENDSDTFVPPVDIFNTANNWTLHVSVPGAKKEDVNVHWDADRSTLGISGLVYRTGDEGFLNTLVSAERRVGIFERRVQLPPPGAAVFRDEDGEKEEVDADHITARMEDGILVVVVPKVEKEWTEVKKVDIE